MATTNNIFLYLTKRDKTGVRILAKFKGKKQLATRLSELSSLQLPSGWEDKLEQIIYDSRMLWEPWIESVDNYDDLKSRLKLRGYRNIPVNSQPEFASDVLASPIVNLSNLSAKKTMIRKNI